MLERWNECAPQRDIVSCNFPSSPSGSLHERAAALLAEVHEARRNGRSEKLDELTSVLEQSHLLVNALNDLGAMIEDETVEEGQFFSQLHLAILKLVFLLEPYVVLRTTLRGERWGMRLRRIGFGARVFHMSVDPHYRDTVQFRGQVLVQGDPTPIKRKKSLPFVPSLRPSGKGRSRRAGFIEQDARVVENTRLAVKMVASDWGESFEEMDGWFPTIT